MKRNIFVQESRLRYEIWHPSFIERVNMTRKYLNHTLNTDPRHREAETQNTNRHKRYHDGNSGKATISILFSEMIGKTRKDTMYCITKRGLSKNNNSKTMEVTINTKSTTTEPLS